MAAPAGEVSAALGLDALQCDSLTGASLSPRRMVFGHKKAKLTAHKKGKTLAAKQKKRVAKAIKKEKSKTLRKEKVKRKAGSKMDSEMTDGSAAASVPQNQQEKVA
jgi:hypothetical protein